MSDAPDIRYLFIRRPIFAGVISIVIVLLGAFALYTLPINRYPPITPPSVQVSAVYPGATAEDVASAVAAPIEQQLSGLDGLLYFKSSNASDGTMNLQVYFDLSRDLDLAAVDVQNQVNLAEPQLPQEVVRQGITITKAQTDILAVIGLGSKDPRYDATYLNNYARIYVIDELKRIPGVGDASGIGNLQFSMLLSLDPDRMAQLGLTVSDVQAAVQEQNTTNPAGRIGREPAPPGNQLTVPVTTVGRLTDPKQFADIIVRANPDGSLVRVKDIGKVTLGSQSYDLVGRVNGVPTAAIRLFLRPGANALNVKKAIVARMNELARSFPAGVTWYIPFDTTPFITASIDEVAKTLFEAMALVTLVVFIFLQSWRTTLIPVLAVPVAIIGTFFGLQMLGFQINLLTLFALVLAIGIVVDDAIVVIENVERIMAEEKVSPRVAADRAMGQVASALVAIVLSLCAVFLPVAFLSGITGQMYKQFAITLVVAVVISGIVALTLTPALCAVLLKPDQGQSRNRLFGWFNRGFGWVSERYLRSVGGVIARPSRWIALFAVMLVLIAVLVRRVPSGFIPTEDKGYFGVVLQLPDGASLQRTLEVTRQIEDYLLKQPAVAYVVNFAGLSFILGTNQTNSASMFVLLKPWDVRTKKQDQLDAVLQGTNRFLFSLKNAVAFGFNLPEIPGLGTTAGLEVNLQDRSVNDIRKFAGLVNEYTQQANAQPELQGVQSLMRVNVPQIYVNVDREKVKSLGVSLSEVFSTLQTMLSTLYVNDFNLYGRTYRVQLEAQSQFRQKPEDIGRLYVRGPDGAMIPISSLVRIEFQGGPSLVQRFNGFTSALVTGQPKPGYSSGQMLGAVRRLADSAFAPRGVGYAFSGQSYQEGVASGQGALIFVLGLVMVFLVLAAQYESWSIPFAVLFGIPFGAFGAFLGVWLRGMASDVYFQIGLLVVVGLAAKNAILIVEFASQLRAQGRSIREAATEAAHERFRPILMTSFAFILGVAPLLIASGAGAESRHSIGTGVFFGMLTATTVGIFFIPLFYYLIGRLGERGSCAAGRLRRCRLVPGPRLAPKASTEMGRLVLGAILVCAAAGCAVGPGYRRPELGVPAEWRRPDPTADSLRPFYDSLVANRDTLPLDPNGTGAVSGDTTSGEGVFLTDTTAHLVWFDLFRDPELRTLVETALKENRDVRVAIATINEFRAQAGVARGDFFPQITLDAQGGRTKTVLGTLGSFSYNQLQATANLSWELDFWGRIRRSTEAARNDLLASRENQRAVILTLVGDVATVYLQLRQLDLELEISRRTLAANRETFRLARRRFDQGLISELDVRQFESEVASPAASVAQLEGQITQTENRLSLLVGRNPGSIPRGRPLTQVLGGLAVPAFLPSSLLERRPDVRQAEAQLHAATARVGAAKGDLFPKLMVTGDYGTYSPNTDNLFTKNSEIYQILGGISMPLFTGGKVGKQVDVARARAEQSRYSYEQTVLTALREVEDAVAGVRASRNQVAAQQTQVDALRRALRLAELRYQSGASSYLDLLDAQRSLFGAELSLAEVQGQQAIAAVTLYKALGGGWPVAASESAAPH